MHPKVVDGMANGVDHDQNAPFILSHLKLDDHRDTTDDAVTIPFHLSLSFAALRVSPNPSLIWVYTFCPDLSVRISGIMKIDDLVVLCPFQMYTYFCLLV